MGHPTAAEPTADLQRVLRAMREQRLHWVELGPKLGVAFEGLAVQFRRPAEAEMHRFVAGVEVDHVAEFVVGWRGFTEATLLGAAIGSSDAVDFSADAWALYVRDHLQVSGEVAQAMADAMRTHLMSRADAAKN